MKSRLLGAVCACVTVLLYVLVGCATQAQKLSQQMTKTFDETSQKSAECYQKAEATNHDAYSVTKEILLSQNDPKALQKMSINGYLTESEKENILVVRELESNCRVIALEGMAYVHPNYVAYLSKWYAKADENTLSLIQNKIAIGEYNTIEHKDIAVRREKFNEVVANINQQLNQSHSYQLSQRQAAARSLQQWSYQQQQLQQNQQMINSINRPTTTNCRYVGSNISCTSY